LLHVHKRSGLFGGPVFIKPIKTILKAFIKALFGWKKANPPKQPLYFWTCKQAKKK